LLSAYICYTLFLTKDAAVAVIALKTPTLIIFVFSEDENYGTRKGVDCIKHAIAVYQIRANPVESAGVSGMYGVHEASYHAVYKWT
jgi:hypothetical protein